MVNAGRVDDIPVGRCRAVADGAAVVARTADGVVAFPNRCLHQDSPLDGGWLDDEVLVCPQHFWRYRITDGELIGGGEGDCLERLAVIVDGDEIRIDLPDPVPPRSLREELLERAARYDRTAAYAQHTDQRQDQQRP